MKRRESRESFSNESENYEASHSGFHTPVKGLIKEMRHKRVTQREFEESTLNRFEWYEQRKQEKLLVHKKQALISKLQEHTQTPQINQKKFAQIPRNPLVNRLDEILESRKVRIESKKESFISKDEREARECTFKPTINNM
jgi:hypothetical protein